MSQQGETDHRQEDEWWRQLYGEADPAVPGPRDPDGRGGGGDTVDDRYASALDALGGAQP
ncbi:MAG: hypothetical protein QOF44_3829, partial [Streptomyces sp.]|nr:hypothetical protein [Streptomyces sp.]